MRLPLEMKLVVDNIRKGRSDRIESENSRLNQEKERKNEAKREIKERKKELKIFTGSVHEFLNEIQGELKEARDIWSDFTKSKSRSSNANGLRLKKKGRRKNN